VLRCLDGRIEDSKTCIGVLRAAALIGRDPTRSPP
jgi:hypothetical protein